MITSALEPLRIRRRGFVSRESLLMSACSFPTSPGKITLSLQWKTGRSATKMDSYTNTETKHPFNLLSSQSSLPLCLRTMNCWALRIYCWFKRSLLLNHKTIRMAFYSSEHQKVSYTLILLWSRKISILSKVTAWLKTNKVSQVFIPVLG